MKALKLAALALALLGFAACGGNTIIEVENALPPATLENVQFANRNVQGLILPGDIGRRRFNDRDTDPDRVGDLTFRIANPDGIAFANVALVDPVVLPNGETTLFVIDNSTEVINLFFEGTLEAPELPDHGTVGDFMRAAGYPVDLPAEESVTR